VIHDPSFDTILMVEKTLIESNDYPKKTVLWKRLPKKVHYSTYKRVLEYLEAHNQIIYNSNTIVYTGIKTEKLKQLVKTSIKI
jgi:hypothetical protein